MHSTSPFKKYQGMEPPYEYIHVPHIDDAELVASIHRGQTRRLYYYFLFLLVISASALGIIYLINKPSGVSTKMTTYDSTNISLSVSNDDYGSFTNTEYSWLAGNYLAEPYKPTTIILNGVSGSASWISIFDDDDTTVYTGTNIQKTFTVPGIYSMVVSNDNFITNHTSTFIVKYVKRELRSLTDGDRRRFLKAASKIWKYSTVEGRAKYGDQFTGIDTLVEEHALASNDIRCDQFHEGSGFFTHHFAITQTFEAALRAVDPSVVLPYWDFTIEGQEIADAGESPSYFLEITPFLSDEWFGSVDENDHIADSKFAFAKMPKVSDDSIVSPNSYGYVRSYWNNNNDPYVTRHLFDVCGVEPKNKRIPDCQTHYDLMKTSTLGDFQTLSPSDGHGTMHVHLGGMGGGCISSYQNFSDTWSSLLDATMTPEEIISHGFSIDEWSWGTSAPRRAIFETKVMGEYFHIYRSLWRSHMCAADGTPNLLVCPDSCDDSIDPTECKCQVESLVNGTTTWENIYDCVLSEHNQALFEKLFPTSFIEDMVLLAATMPSIEGEMLESASPADILFWVIHPTIERVLAAKRLGASFAQQSVETWSETEDQWYSYSYYSLAENENSYWTEAYTCSGHDSDDPVLPSTLPLLNGFAEKADSDGNGIVSNWEYYNVIDPNNADGLDYVFDMFTWSHCDDKIE